MGGYTVTLRIASSKLMDEIGHILWIFVLLRFSPFLTMDHFSQYLKKKNGSF